VTGHMAVSEPERWQACIGKKSPVLLYDGSCGMCSSIVQFILRADRRGTLHFASLESEFAKTVLTRHPDAQGIDSMVWVEFGQYGERVLLQSDAAMRICAYLGGVWQVLVYLGGRMPERLRSAIYDFVARRRLRWFGPPSSCPLPSADQRRRIIT
jgi:predicted DCC family thiol-disulfide oxidoreductase YuxK